MKILKLVAENVKKLRAVEITPTGELVEITGKNGAGKSSVLDSIWWALAGTKHIQAVPIRTGETKARIRLDLGELIVERRFSEAGSTLTVENTEGARYKSPQAMLDGLLGALSFDPLAFVHQPPKKQFETLIGIVRLDVDVDQLDGLNRKDFDQRADVNRDAKALRARADGIRVPEGLPGDAVDVASLKDRLENAAKHNAEIETRKGRREQVAVSISDRRKIAKEKRAQALKLQADADEIDAQADDFQARIDAAEPLPGPMDAQAIRAELDHAETINRGIAQREAQAHLAKESAQKEAEAKDLTERINARTQQKAEAIARAKMPVPGLGFGDGVVTFGGIPFDQASTAEQLRVSVAMAMAANPKLRVVRIKEGSSLDASNLALIAGMAKENDFQVWVERVDSSGKVGIVIEDGRVAP